MNIFLILLIIFIVIIYYYNKKYTYYIRKNCKYLMVDTLKNILEENKKFNKNIYIPCTYNGIDIEYNYFPYDTNGIYFLIDGINKMVSKDLLYKLVKTQYGENKTLSLMPKSWIISEDKNKFINEFDPNNIYILKKNIQQQKGLYITNNIDDIIKEFNNYKNKKKYPYIIVQELLQDPYLINERKINMRIYVLVTKIKDNFNVYVYNDGFMYYTSNKFKYNSLDPKDNITTGYIDRQVYEENPLTHQDFRKYLINKHDNNTSDLVFNNINNLIKDIFIVFKNNIGNNKKLYNNLKFQLFGADVAIDNKYGAKLMEINKGPDLATKDKRDSEIKHNLVRNIFNIVGLANYNIINNFIKII